MKTKLLFILPLLAVMIASCNSNAQYPKATIAGMSGGEAAVKQILADSMLTMDGPGLVVTSFRMSAYIKDKDAVEVESKTAYLTAPMREAIAQATPGTKIYFEYIRAKNSKGDSLKLSLLAFVIK